MRSMWKIPISSPLQVTPFIFAFLAMNNLVEVSFWNTKIEWPKLEKCLTHIKKTVKVTGTSETLKIHGAISHFKHGLHFLGNRGLGLWSEQAGESIHTEFLHYWKRYKINLDEDNYGHSLEKAVIDFSADHIKSLY